MGPTPTSFLYEIFEDYQSILKWNLHKIFPSDTFENCGYVDLDQLFAYKPRG